MRKKTWRILFSPVAVAIVASLLIVGCSSQPAAPAPTTAPAAAPTTAPAKPAATTAPAKPAATTAPPRRLPQPRRHPRHLRPPIRSPARRSR